MRELVGNIAIPKVRNAVENLEGKFTVFVDLNDVSALTDEQFTEDYEKMAVRHKNIAFVFYNAQKANNVDKKERLDKLQEQLGAHRIGITDDDFSALMTRQWIGKLIHVSKGKRDLDANLIQAALLKKDVYLFRYVENEVGVVPTALVFTNQDIKGFEGKVIDLSMISERIRSEVHQYLASLEIARAA